ncbi:(4Fe-4S)-binding protein [Ectobacillus sp. sgz5001026]|uniref:(4Fe-4S)-binding protein n=1 Tax=Ectobacillus sp. sgz5001026 TaxID=3242473 RepID=UPI0036D3DDBE
MNNEPKRYIGEQIDVIFHTERCVHAAKCVKGLPKVFNVNKKPWVNADGEEASKIAKVIEECPSGALEYIRKDSGEQEVPKDKTTVEVAANGMIYLTGNLEIQKGDETIPCTRATLCGCGSSKNKPFCDNSHLKNS